MRLNGKLSFVNGVFSVYKPPGITSFGVVERLKHIITAGQSTESFYFDRRGRSGRWVKVGHGGTLDSSAEGVLVIGVGSGCKRLTQYLECDKVYVAGGVLGKTTNTLDSDGVYTDERPCDHVSRLHLEMALKSFEGKQRQIPPLYSALKFNGKRASDWAHEGMQKDMESKARTVNIMEITLRHFDLPMFEVKVKCSSGTYIRSLIRDIGIKLDTVAYVSLLCRTKQGQHDIKTALTQERWTHDNILSALR